MKTVSSAFWVNISLIHFSSLGLQIIFSAWRVMSFQIHFSAIRVKTPTNAFRVSISPIHFSSLGLKIIFSALMMINFQIHLSTLELSI